MIQNKWDKYFYSHYRPRERDWGKKDLLYYKNWYYAWIKYIDTKISFGNVFQKKPKILEIGCGIGGVSAILEEKGWNVTGSDVSRKIIKMASRVNNNVSFIFCDIQKKITGKYDAIFGFEVLEHIPNADKAIKNIKNSLKKGGFFIGSSPYPFPKAYTDPTHTTVLYPNEWKKLFKAEKFRYVATYPISLIPFIWRINKRINVILPFYVPFSTFVSTTLIIAKK